jgi:hypothetical protein
MSNPNNNLQLPETATEVCDTWNQCAATSEMQFRNAAVLLLCAIYAQGASSSGTDTDDDVPAIDALRLMTENQLIAANATLSGILAQLAGGNLSAVLTQLQQINIDTDNLAAILTQLQQINVDLDQLPAMANSLVQINTDTNNLPSILAELSSIDSDMDELINRINPTVVRLKASDGTVYDKLLWFNSGGISSEIWLNSGAIVTPPVGPFTELEQGVIEVVEGGVDIGIATTIPSGKKSVNITVTTGAVDVSVAGSSVRRLAAPTATFVSGAIYDKSFAISANEYNVLPEIVVTPIAVGVTPTSATFDWTSTRE